MEGPSLLGFCSIPIVLRYSQGCARASPQKLLLDGLDSPLKTQGMLQGMVAESDFAVSLSQARQEKLNPLLLCAARKWPSPDSCEHLGTTVVVRDRDHFLHEAYARWGTHTSTHGRVSLTESDNKRAQAWGEITHKLTRET